MIFSVNQVRHFYALLDRSASSAKDLGDKPVGAGFIPSELNAEGDFYLMYKGASGDVMRSDLIKAKNVKSVSLGDAEKMAIDLKGVAVTLSDKVNGGKPVVGQDYVLRVIFREFLSNSPKDQIVKLATAHASTEDAGDLYKKLAISLARNSVMETPLMKIVLAGADKEVTASTKEEDIEGTPTGILIYQVEQEWHLGTMQQGVIPFDVYGNQVQFNGDSVNWAEFDKDIKSPDGPIKNGHMIADLEYFCMGERGDQYRNVGWPNVIPTKYLIDPEGEYDVVTIHYYFQGNNEAVQLSERDMQIAVKKGEGQGLYNDICKLLGKE